MLFERVENGAGSQRTFELEFDLAVDPSQIAQMRRQNDADHGNVWTSTESTAGRSRTIGAQWSPESAEQ